MDFMGPAKCSDSDPLAGPCKYWRQFTGMDCRQHSSKVDIITTRTGGYVGPGGRCWTTSLLQAVGINNYYTSCYKS